MISRDPISTDMKATGTALTSLYKMSLYTWLLLSCYDLYCDFGCDYECWWRSCWASTLLRWICWLRFWVSSICSLEPNSTWLFVSWRCWDATFVSKMSNSTSSRPSSSFCITRHRLIDFYFVFTDLLLSASTSCTVARCYSFIIDWFVARIWSWRSQSRVSWFWHWVRQWYSFTKCVGCFCGWHSFLARKYMHFVF